MAQKSPYTGRIKIFLDGADRASMAELAGNPAIHGFTTNPSLVRKAGVKDYRTFCKEILPLVKGKPISFEVFADEPAEMRRQAREIASWETPGSKLYVKIPVVNSKGEPCAPLVRELRQNGIKLNVTALYRLPDIWETCLALQGGAPSIVSVFAGRLADTGRDPLPTMQAAVEMCRSTGEQVECLWASTREAYNVVQAEQIGCHIITAPLDVVKKVASFNKDVWELTLDTVRTFKSDSEAAGFTL